MECKECDRLKGGVCAVVAALINRRHDSALNLARVVMYGGSVNNALDCADPKRHQQASGADRANECGSEAGDEETFNNGEGW